MACVNVLAGANLADVAVMIRLLRHIVASHVDAQYPAGLCNCAVCPEARELLDRLPK